MQPSDFSKLFSVDSSAKAGELVLELKALQKQFYLHERQTTIHAFEGLSLKVHAGRMTCLVGASGSGKSSVLRSIYRSYIPSGGEVIYHAEDGSKIDLVQADEQTILQLRRHEIRLVSQFLKALPRQTTMEVVAWPLRELGIDRDQAMDQAHEIVQTIGIPERLWRIPPATFSGGEKQLVNLARAMVITPRLLLLDEPTASLDPKSTELIVDALEKMKARNIAMLSIFHNRSIVDRLADERLDMSGGIDLGPAETLNMEEVPS